MHTLKLDRAAYLANVEVRCFIEWLANATRNGNFPHQYTTAKGAAFVFKDLDDAHLQYDWSFSAITGTPGCPAGSSFAQNLRALSVLQSLIRSAHDDDSMVSACVAVFKWGKVMNGNASWVTSHAVGLHAALTASAADLGKVLKGGPAHLSCNPPRFNAGLSKVYSLLVDGLIIYDSRVAAALGFAVQRWNASKGRASSAIPAALRFPWAVAKGGQNRNPGAPMPRLQSGLMHAWAAIYASMILDEVSLLTGLTPRQLESALFMLGYEVPPLLPAALHASPRSLPVHAESQEASQLDVPETSGEDEEVPSCSGRWIKSYTPTRKSVFFWRFSRNDCRIERCSPDGPRLLIKADELVAMLDLLHKEFGGNGFPLSNSATGVRAPNPPRGVGLAFFEVTNRNPPDSSRVAAICEDLGLFIRIPSAGKIKWELTQRALATIYASSSSGNCEQIDVLVEDSYAGE